MSEKGEFELPSSELQNTTDLEASIEEQITVKECCKATFKPPCRVRQVKNKGAILVIIWNYMIGSIFYNLLNETTRQNDFLYYILSAVPIIALPLTGAIADMRFGRYKVISFSLWIVWIVSILLTAMLALNEIIMIQYMKYVSVYIHLASSSQHRMGGISSKYYPVWDRSAYRHYNNGIQVLHIMALLDIHGLRNGAVLCTAVCSLQVSRVFAH